MELPYRVLSYTVLLGYFYRTFVLRGARMWVYGKNSLGAKQIREFVFPLFLYLPSPRLLCLFSFLLLLSLPPLPSFFCLPSSPLSSLVLVSPPFPPFPSPPPISPCAPYPPTPLVFSEPFKYQWHCFSKRRLICDISKTHFSVQRLILREHASRRAAVL